jgi:RNA polymerase primary sigma factor
VVAVTAFKHPALKQLTDQQVRFAPPARRLEQLARAEKLLIEVEAGKRYPYAFICYRITDYRPETHTDLLIEGEELAHDLRLMIAALADKIGALAERVEASVLRCPPASTEEPHEPIITLDEISKRWNVSTKTIRRWRKLGLVGQPVVCNGRRRVGFVQSVVERFLAAYPERVERGSRFSQMTEVEREDVLRRAKRLSRVVGGTLTEVSRRIARRLGRSVETVRYTIKNFDREHPQEALVPHLTGPLDAETKQTIYSSYRRGIDVDTLAKRFQRTRTSMYRVINEVRAQRLLEQPLEYIYNPEFDDPTREVAMLAPMPEAAEYEHRQREMRLPRPGAGCAFPRMRRRSWHRCTRCRCSPSRRSSTCSAR